MEDVKGLETIKKYLESLEKDKLMEIYELTLQQEEDDADCIITEYYE